ncbi:serine protease inhibitor [Pseudarthrobacter sp. H3Y2-7]|uniref:serine protease inhibitor n=1 Tax=Pseudarthrobacter TaxID=1742993 RepID=UPI0023B15D5A|nr:MULTISPECIES: serine protease inhibitor [unclassified Pseudarthrobacter]MDE8668773.1 serine protease inhibitor [Pseudarthrobacter sp. H3Y2-7]
MTGPAGENTDGVDLTIRLREDPAAGEYVFRLVAAGGRVLDGSTLPAPVAALEAVERFGQDTFFPKPGPPRLCTQQYGGPQVAEVTGTFHGRRVRMVFRRTDGCEIARWNAMSALLGGTPGAGKPAP